MNIEDWFGLRILQLDADEALGQEWITHEGPADIARVRNPAISARGALRAIGFTSKPAWITWVSEVYPHPGDHVERLGASERWAVRAGQRAVHDNGVAFAVTAPLTAVGLDSFLEVYTEQVAQMRFGVPFAALERDNLLAGRDNYCLLAAIADGALIGGCLCRWDAVRRCLTIRFTATKMDSRRSRLVRPMYMKAIALAAEFGADRVSLGTDPSLYGHLAQPGLFEFKSRFGFVPVPAAVWDPAASEDEADLVLFGNQLSQPTLLVGYEPAGFAPITCDTPLQLARWAQLTIVGDVGDGSVKPYDAEFLTSLRRLGPVAQRARALSHGS